MRWKRLRWPLFAVLLVVLGHGAVFLYWTEAQHRFRAITEGKVYQSAQMPPEDLRAVVQEKGIRTVIDLRKPEEEASAEREGLAGTGVNYVHIPTDHKPRPEAVQRFLEVMDGVEYPVLIHCEHGEGRSVTFSALYRIEYEKWSPEEAVRGVRRLPPSIEYLNDLLGIGAFGDDNFKAVLLRKYVPRRDRPAGSPEGSVSAETRKP